MRLLVISQIANQQPSLAALLARESAAPLAGLIVLGGTPAGAEPPASGMAPLADPTLLALLGRPPTCGSPVAPVYLLPGAGDGAPEAIKQAIQPYADRMHLIHRCAAGVGERDVLAGFGGQIGGSPASGRLIAADWELRACFEQLATTNRRFQVAQRRVFLFADRPDAATSPARNTMLRIYQPNLVCYSAAEPFNGHIDGIWTVSPGALAAGWYAIVNLQQRYVEFKRLETPGPAAIAIELPALKV